MEQLTESVSVSFEVSSIPNNPDCPHPRFAQYKARNNVPDQQERRRRLLEEQKQKRSESFNTSRGLIEDLSDFTGEHDMEWTATKAKPRLRKYKNKLMLSEWLVHIPEDLAELWYLVPCPKGRRTLVVATGGHTQAFLKNGCLKSTYQSALPGGNRDDVKGCTILDCIWNTANCSYYVLDVLAWSNQPLLDCETEFRFYWLKSKLEEISCLSKQSKENAYAFISLPYHQCDISTMTNIMATENLFGQEGPALDGLLFYHSQAHYIPGITPLVGWLKPHMMPEVLGLPVAPVYLQEEMESDKKLGRKKCRRFHKHQGKSQQDVTSDNDSTTEMETNIVSEAKDSYNESLVEEMEPEDSSLNTTEESEVTSPIEN